MPTYNFLYERLVDHQAAVEAAPSPPSPPTLECAVCGVQGSTGDWLSEHMRVQHPLAAPQLVIEGRPSTRSVTRRAPLGADAVTTANASQASVQIDGRPPVAVEPYELAAKLAALRSNHAR